MFPFLYLLSSKTIAYTFKLLESRSHDTFCWIQLVLHLAQNGMLLEARHYLPALRSVFDFSPNSFLLEWVAPGEQAARERKTRGVSAVYFLWAVPLAEVASGLEVTLTTGYQKPTSFFVPSGWQWKQFPALKISGLPCLWLQGFQNSE